MDYAFNVPINSLSFGSVSLALLREAYKRKHEPSIFPVGGRVDITAQLEDKEFNQWLQNCINKSTRHFKRNHPVLKLWHLNSGIESYGNRQILLTFHETDSPTPEEINVIKNNHKVIFTNEYSKNIFKDYGCDNIIKIPLGFDSFNFKRTEKEYFKDGRITFNLLGKFEKRKGHAKVIQTWLKKYGDNPKYFLNCALWNHFIQPEQQKQIFQQILQGKRYGNIEFLAFMPTNAFYNDYLNAGDIVVGMSGGEGYGLGEFNSLALGKHAVILNAHAYKEYADNENSILVNPNGKEPAYDGMFFHQGQPFNQGNFFTWAEEEFIEGCEKAIKKVQNNRLNTEGLKIQEKFKYSNTFDAIYGELEKLI